MASHDQKTEEPTQRRLLKAREDGNFASAKLFVSAVQFTAFVAALGVWGGDSISAMHENLAELLRHAVEAQLAPAFLVKIGTELVVRAFFPLAMVAAVLMGVTLGAQLLVTRMGFTLKKLTPDVTRLNPMSRLKELPSQNLAAAAQAAVMLPIFGWVVYVLVNEDFAGFLTMPLRSVNAGVAVVANSIQRLLWRAACLFLAFGVVDLFRQHHRRQKELRMSKQEIRDEHKEIEGNPLIKSRIRRIRRDTARRRMMHEVPRAAAVIVNPTHYAVALQYTMNSTGAPKVVAKGKNYLALRIRQKAIENQVPLIENPPLAQALYKSVDVGQEIPAQFYRAVAEVLAYVFRLMNARAPV
jgi:flagellar biosynthesis protein FlhB